MALTKVKTMTMKIKDGAVPKATHTYYSPGQFNIGLFKLELLAHAGTKKCMPWVEVGYGGNWSTGDCDREFEQPMFAWLKQQPGASSSIKYCDICVYEEYELREFFHKDLTVALFIDKDFVPIQVMLKLGDKGWTSMLTLKKEQMHDWDPDDYEFLPSVEKIVDVTLTKHDDGTATIETKDMEPLSNN